MEFVLSFLNVMFVGWMWDRIRRIEKVINRIDPQALKDAASDDYRSNW